MIPISIIHAEDYFQPTMEMGDAPYTAKTAKQKINVVIGLRTKKFMSWFAGHETVYRLKVEEAKDYLERRPNHLEDHPFLKAELGVTADDPAELANIWLTKWDEMRFKLASFEAKRVQLRKEIDSVTEPSHEAYKKIIQKLYD